VASESLARRRKQGPIEEDEGQKQKEKGGREGFVVSDSVKPGRHILEWYRIRWIRESSCAAEAPTGPYGMGTVYYDYNRLGPFLQTTLWRITAFEPPSHQVHESESTLLPSKMTLNLSPAPEGTRLQMAVEYRFLPQLGPVGRFLEALLMNRMLKQVLKQNQASLNAYLTAGLHHLSMGRK
jgi:hypothetical protein